MAIEDILRKEADRQIYPNAALMLSTAADTITKLKLRLDKAKFRLDKLDALEAAGVDNWEGYGDAMAGAFGEEEDD